MLKAGEMVPEFAAESDGGVRVTDADLRGARAVVYFYPKDDTPGCTTEAKDFTAKKAEFEALGVRVFGVSKDTVASHCRFRDKHGLAVTLLSDPSLAMQRAFGAFGEKLMYGKKVEGTIRSTFVVGPDGRVTHVWPTVKVAGHVDAVLAALRAG
jgi:peroxiredoxin Q/BCP